MTVTLVRLYSRPHLNGTTAVLQKYLRRRALWKVLLPDGQVFAARAENMKTREMLAQLPYRKFGRPLATQASFAELVRVVEGEHGRGLVARRDIARGTWARDEKVQLVLTAGELRELKAAFDAHKEEAVPRMMGFSGRVIFEHSHEMPEYASRISSFVGTFMLDGHLESAGVQELMAYDHLSDGYLEETLERLVMFDVLYFDFWRTQLAGRFSADEVWRAMTFLLSHAFLHDDCVLSLGLFSLAQCDERRWTWYEEEVRTRCAPPIAGTLGNINDVAPWGVQSEVRSGEVAGDKCVLFTQDVLEGESLRLDYGANYKVNDESQLKQFGEEHELRAVVDTVLGHLDARVMQAMQRHYSS
jgi:hypothetical protein